MGRICSPVHCDRAVRENEREAHGQQCQGDARHSASVSVAFLQVPAPHRSVVEELGDDCDAGRDHCCQRNDRIHGEVDPRPVHRQESGVFLHSAAEQTPRHKLEVVGPQVVQVEQSQRKADRQHDENDSSAGRPRPAANRKEDGGESLD